MAFPSVSGPADFACFVISRSAVQARAPAPINSSSYSFRGFFGRRAGCAGVADGANHIPCNRFGSSPGGDASVRAANGGASEVAIHPRGETRTRQGDLRLGDLVRVHLIAGG